MRLRSADALGALLLLCLPGCGGEAEDRAPQSIGSLSPAIAEAWAGTTEFQRAMLRDGDLTYAEYERAVLGTMECLQSEGVTIRGELKRGPEPWRLAFGFSAGPDLNSVATINTIYDRCFDEYQSYIDYIWSVMNEPTGEELQKAYSLLRECVDADTPVPALNTPAFAQWIRSVEKTPEFTECVENIRETTRVWIDWE